MRTLDHENMHPAHARVWELLPWYENRSLDAHEMREVEAHLGECLVCGRELRKLERLTAAVAVPAEDHACTEAFVRLSERINASNTTTSDWSTRLTAGLRSVFEPVPLIAGASLLVVSSVLVAVIVLNGETTLSEIEQPFQTLGQKESSAAPMSHPLFRVVLRNAPGDAGLDAWLVRHEADLVDGPSDIGVLTVKVATGRRSFDAVLGEIRADAETIFVEPVNIIGTRPDRLR